MPKSTTPPDALWPRHDDHIAVAFADDEPLGIRNDNDFGAEFLRPMRSRAYASTSSLPPTPQGSLPNLLAGLWLGGTFTRWTTAPNFKSLPHCYSPFQTSIAWSHHSAVAHRTTFEPRPAVTDGFGCTVVRFAQELELVT
jgi:hypothetical protein